jgi:hypothetical protein
MRQLVLALALCFAVATVATPAQTHKAPKVKAHKVKGRKAARVKARKAAKHAPANHAN